ncbi:MAG TPA: type II and III secretion system protein family protein [Pararobbsia sp.]|nr:type II and III secretion system protein family protein [Pararobbsia sp.]
MTTRFRLPFPGHQRKKSARAISARMTSVATVAFVAMTCVMMSDPARAKDVDANSTVPTASTAPTPVQAVPGASDSHDGSHIPLVVGVQQSLAVGKTLSRVAIGDPGVADVMVMRGNRAGNLLLIAKAPGTTSLLVWTRDAADPQRYTIDVTSAAAHALADPNGATIASAGSTAIIKGTSPSVVSHERAVAAARATTDKDGVVIDQSTIAVSPVVQVDVKVVEFSRSVLKQFGFNFQKMNNGFTYSMANPGTVATAAPLSSAFNLLASSTAYGFIGSLSVLEGDGLARVLAEPTLVALSGQSANFLAGGEVPIPVPQGLGSTAIEYKPYGVGLTLTPTVLGPNRIALKVAPEASDLDFAHGVTISGVSVPAIVTRRADTTVELGDGESFVIGGLIDRETTQNVDKVPLLGDLPVIGVFFKSLNYQQTDKELIIVVTPHLVSPLAKGTEVPLPGDKQEQRDGPVWRSYVGGMASRDALPGFSK